MQPQTFEVPPPPHVWGLMQVPQVYVPPQPFETVPQFFPEHAVLCGITVHPHTFGVPLPPHVWGLVQLPQVYVPPQPLETVPQFFPEHAVA
ncbi:hypothetical protein JY651_48900 [Pyxidicoccus parkwayensis]|uniref:Uncharacterized protein n=1 Tax=Pyxidicoccus parkwayensis TaxID=2813578 RepID=A0ABX7NVK8_9BACT|nr:hypothetical protein [Pyxidicoccus parkwaysis]QSQ22932.1 hypothetical protein JY651_48900 [Pyxidicoccus parkwaysis]